MLRLKSSISHDMWTETWMIKATFTTHVLPYVTGEEEEEEELRSRDAER